MFRKTLLTATVVAVAVLCARVGFGAKPESAEAPSIELGGHLVAIAGCNDCHTPFKLGPNGPEPDMTRMLSGHPAHIAADVPPRLSDGPWVWAATGTNTAFAGPWGITYSANLTPDENTGMGIWTEDMFVRAMRTGKHMGQSRTIQPPMPWPALARMTDHELRSVYAYLRTVPRIENLVPDYREPERLAELEDERP